MGKVISLFSVFFISTILSANEAKIQVQMSNTKPIQKEVIINNLSKKSFDKLSSKTIKKLLKIKNPSKLSKKLTKKYYKYHNYKPFFISQKGIKSIGTSLINIIKEDPVLKPNLNKLIDIEKVELQINKIKTKKDIKELIKTDFMLISIYHKYMTYLSKGIIDWKTFQEQLKLLNEEKEIIANWKKYNVRKNKRTLLYKAVKANDIKVAINKVNYTFPKSKELSKKIKQYEQLVHNGGFIKIPFVKKSMRKGNYYPELKQLRQRLMQSNDLKDIKCIGQEETTKLINNCEELFDENIFQAVKSFQKNHGLVQDGIVGKNTIRKLNISAEEKIEKMRINLERMRWMPRKLGKKYVLVNIPEYNLKMYKEGKEYLQMPVVVGEKEHPTPIFSHAISKIVLNPYWRIPQRIVKREIIPKLVEDPTYLNKNEIKTFANWSHDSMQYDTSNLDWSMYLDNDLIGTSKEAPMRFIQIPGKKNPLGKMKFLFPNKYSVYLHDTPHKKLFKKNKRAYSHGCIRLEKPNELLKAIVQEETKIDYNETQEILSEMEKTDFGLSKKVPVHIVYLTSWIDEEGNIQFRDDIYNYDKMQSKLIYNKSL